MYCNVTCTLAGDLVPLQPKMADDKFLAVQEIFD